MNWIAYVIWQCLAYTVHLFMVVYYIYVKIRKDQYTCNYLELLGVLLGGAVEASFSQVQRTWKSHASLILIEHTKSGTSPWNPGKRSLNWACSPNNLETWSNLFVKIMSMSWVSRSPLSDTPRGHVQKDEYNNMLGEERKKSMKWNALTEFILIHDLMD